MPAGCYRDFIEIIILGLGCQDFNWLVIPDVFNREFIRSGHSRQLLSGIHLRMFQRDIY